VLLKQAMEVCDVSIGTSCACALDDFVEKSETGACSGGGSGSSSSSGSGSGSKCCM